VGVGGAVAGALLVVRDHGSKTSSMAACLDAVRPDVAVASAGYRNRFGHPHRDVVARYLERGIDFETTVERGALVWDSARPDALRAAVSDRRWVVASNPDDG